MQLKGETLRRVNEAKALEQRLKAEGRPADADIVGRLRRSHIQIWETASRLHRDNADLRAAPENVAQRGAPETKGGASDV